MNHTWKVAEFIGWVFAFGWQDDRLFEKIVNPLDGKALGKGDQR